MAKYICECRTFEVKGKTSIKIVDGRVVTPEAYCEECGNYGDYIKEHDGFGGIIKKKGGKVGKIK